jgi:hypothetical protein
MKERRKSGYAVHKEFEDFTSFLLHVGPRPDSGYTLDRIDNDNRNYGPGLCEWKDKSGQANNRSSTIKMTLDDETLPLMAWAGRTGQKPDTMRKRLKAGWTDKEVIKGERILGNINGRPKFREEPVPWRGTAEERIELEAWYRRKGSLHGNRYKAYIERCHWKHYWLSGAVRGHDEGLRDDLTDELANKFEQEAYEWRKLKDVILDEYEEWKDWLRDMQKRKFNDQLRVFLHNAQR